MSKTYKKPPEQRNENWMVLLGRKPGPMKDRRDPRGGARDPISEFLEEEDLESLKEMGVNLK